MSKQIKSFWIAIGFNIAVAVMNLGFLINNLAQQRWWQALTSAILIVLNSAVAVMMYRGMIAHKQHEKERVVDILSGKYS